MQYRRDVSMVPLGLIDPLPAGPQQYGESISHSQHIAMLLKGAAKATVYMRENAHP